MKQEQLKIQVLNLLQEQAKDINILELFLIIKTSKKMAQKLT